MLNMKLESVKNAKWFGSQPDEWLRYILDIHFDPCDGSKYWLKREKELKIDVKNDMNLTVIRKMYNDNEVLKLND